MAERANHPREIIDTFSDLRGESDRLFGLRFDEDELAAMNAKAIYTDAELEEMYALWRSQIVAQDENPPAKETAW